MRVVSVVCALPPYKAGMGMVALREAQALVRETTVENVTLISMGAPAGTGQSTGRVTIQYLKTWWRVGLAGTLRGLAKVVQECDVVHLHYPFFGSNELVALYAWWYHKPLVITYHMDARDRGLRRVVYTLYQKFITPLLLKKCSALVCASFDYLSQSAAAGFFKRHPERCHEIPFGIDTAVFAPGAPDINLKQQHALPKDTPYILFVGALDTAHYFKGVPVLLKAFAALSQSPEHHLVIVGDGNCRSRYEEYAQELQIKNRVHFVGRADEKNLQKWYQGASFFVLPSLDKSEAFGLVLEEALSSGIPCVSSNLAGVKTLIECTNGGELAEPGNVESLHKALVAVIARKKSDPTWGAHIRARAITLFSQKTNIALLYEIYKRIVDHSKN